MARSPLAAKLLLAFVGAPALVVTLLALVELGFVVAGCDPRSHYFDETTDEQGRPLWIASRNPPVAGASFRTPRFLQRPPAGTQRVVCVGDSTCWGLPFDPPVPFYCWIEARLKELLPDVATEVVNLGSNGFASEDVLDVLRDADGAGADVLVVYVGHNEFLDRNLLPLLNPLAHAVRRTLARSRSGTRWMTAAHQPADVKVLSQSIRPSSIRDAPFFTAAQFETGWRRYRDHLTRIVELAQSRGARVVLVHPICDAVDTPVEMSSFSAATPPERRAEFRNGFDELRRGRDQMEKAHKLGAPIDPARLAALFGGLAALERIDATVAALHHERGRLLLLSDRIEEARREFSSALEQDEDPIRATAKVHAILDDVARATGALVVDPRPALDAAAAPGLPRQDVWFVDYVHPDVRGHELLADAILRVLARANVLAPEPRWRFGSEPTSDEYLRRGGWKPTSVAASKAREALFLLIKTHYEGGGDAVTEGARNVFEHSLQLDPECSPAHLGLGMCAVLRKQGDEAIAHFDRAAAIRPAELDQLRDQYRDNVAVRALFDAAGLTLRDGRVVHAR